MFKQANQVILGWTLIICWISSSFALLWQQNSQYYGVFDPNRQLEQLPQYLPADIDDTGQKDYLVAVIASDCYCSSGAVRHLDELRQNTKSTIDVFTPQQMAEFGLQIPASPALLWWRNGELWYAGPIASGLACSSSNDLINSFLTGEQRLPAQWLNFETESCRCPNFKNYR